MIEFNYNDGGRQAAGYKGETRDCVVRAIVIATEKPYKEVYDAMYKGKKDLAKGRSVYACQAKKHTSPRAGVQRKVYEKYLLDSGFTWVPKMQIGSGCQTHLRKDELPSGTLIVRLSKHLACVIDGILHDISDCSREGTRCVYGYFLKQT